MTADRPRARRDLLISRQEEAGTEYVVVKDPRSRRYFRFRVPEWWLVEQMDGSRDTAELAQAFTEKFGAQLPPASLDAFLERLHSLHVLDTPDAERVSASFSEREEAERGLGRLLFIKIKAVDPDRWLGALAERLRFLLRPWFWPASLLVIVGALLIVAANRSAFSFTLAGMLQAESIVAIVLAIFVTVALHEVAHGVTCRHLGGHVHEMGLLLLYFQPCLYCDLSDAWLFKEKWKKLLVTFSGAYFQILLGAAAVWAWRITALDTWPSQLFWLVAVVSLFNVLFNFNPLIKLDGYYLLSDWLGVPNLRARAFQWIGHRLLGRAWTYAEYPPKRERRIYWYYGSGALLYSVFLIGYLALVALTFAIERWRGTGLVLYLLLAALIFRRPLGKALEAATPRALYKVKKLILWGLAGVVLLVVALVPFAYRVGSPARIEPWGELVISVLPDGYLATEWYDHGEASRKEAQISKLVASELTTLTFQPAVNVGDSVSVGDTVLRISADQFLSLSEEAMSALSAKQSELDLLLSPPKPEEVAELQARIQEAEALVQQGTQDYERAKSLVDRNLSPRSALEVAETALRAVEARLESARQKLALLQAPPKQEQVSQLEAEIAGLRRQATFYDRQLESTVFTSPISGRVVRLASRSGEVCRIARTDSVRCVVDVEEAYARLIQPDQEFTLKIPSSPFGAFDGLIVRISPVGDTTGNNSVFPAVGALVNPGELSPGMTGYAKITTGRRTLAWRIVRRLARFIRIEFWSWW